MFLKNPLVYENEKEMIDDSEHDWCQWHTHCGGFTCRNLVSLKNGANKYKKEGINWV